MGSENSLNFVKFDYTSHRDALLQRVRSRWSTAWNDFLANSFGRVLVDLVAWSTSNTAFLLNRLAAENFLPTMTLRESAVRLGQFFLYQLRNPGAAVVLCDAQLSGTVLPGELVTLAKGTAISVAIDEGALIFEVSRDYTITEGKTAPEELILTVAANSTGEKVLKTNFIATANSANLDLADTTVDLSEFAEIGQSVRQIGSSTIYRISEIAASPTATKNNRLILDRGWESSTGAVEADIIEQRVELTEGQTFVENYVSPQVETPNLTLKLSRTPVIQDSVSVLVNGIAWTIGSLSLADKDDQIVEVRSLVDKSTIAVFGDGVLGAMPATESQIDVTYRVGGGSVGNVDIGTVSATVVANKSGSSTAQVQIQLNNGSSPGLGGTDFESLSEARSNIPPHIRANDRGVTAGDYEILAGRFSHPVFGQVRYARAVTKSENSLLEGNIVTIYAWTTGPSGGLTPLSSALKRSLQEYLQSKVVGTDYVVINDGAERPAPIALRFKTFTGYSVTSIKALIEEAISSVITAGKPGQPVIFSNLIHTLDGLQGVDSITMASPTGDLEPASANEVFVPPRYDYNYDVALLAQENFTYAGQSPVAPLQAWAFKAFLDDNELIVLPDTTPGQARLVGPGIAPYDVGLLVDRPAANTGNENGFYFATDTRVLYRSTGSDWLLSEVGGSFVNLLTGQVVVSTTGNSGQLHLRLVPVQGYDLERSVNLFIGYSGNSTLAKRREIRSALRTWSNGFKIGGSLFAAAQKNSSGEITLDTSRSNVTDTVLSVSGVTGVNKVSLETPSNGNNRIDASSSELIKIGTVTINGYVD